MQETQTVVYWLDAVGGAHHQLFAGHDQLTQALTLASDRRKEGCRFVATATENVDHVGRAGVDSVQAGRLPSGKVYTWRKRRPA